MSNAQATPTPPAKPLDWAAAEKHLTAIKNKVFEYSGKAGHNPYMWWDKNVGQLEAVFSNEKSKTVINYDLIMKVKFEVPVAPTLGVNLRKPSPKQNVIIT